MKLAKQIAIGLHTESKTEKPQRLADIFKSAGAKRAMNGLTTFILRGLDHAGRISYYTGKAGPAWVSYSQGDAFEYSTIEEARRRALMHNKSQPLHGLRFIAIGIA